ncbi:hairy/enhancer-of-split related with YRPW motif protein-like [Neodiprion fabricii]|uniref:hairy/enhancer-of-split related with YRPW motif protein-like n=1 Tax=Neodiprion fabricii TaxID=2872261 RepID=UPI001ED94612|nr:hairy/enhancer-of-split related with YRPW motif protein-like [Neodiprion fabricii]
MWRVVVPRSDENSTLLSSDITAGAVTPGHLPSLSGPSGPHHWGYPPPPHPSYQPQHPDVRHHHEMRHDMQRPELRHPADIRHEMRHDNIAGMRPDLTELRPSHELPELKNDITELRAQDNQQQQQQQLSQSRGMKRTMSDSDCDDVFSEESGKEPCNSPGGDSCQHASRKRRRGMIEKKRRDRINASLGELRRLVPAAARDPHSGKLEKAEILQLTVEHLRTLRNKGPEGYDSTKLAMDYHAVGWGECAAEVGRYLVTMEGLDERDPLRLRLLSHLQSFHREHPPTTTAVLPSGSSVSSATTTGSYEPSSSSSVGMPAAPGSMPPLLGSGALGWGQYPGQYVQQQHGKPYRPWGAELAY